MDNVMKLKALKALEREVYSQIKEIATNASQSILDVNKLSLFIQRLIDSKQSLVEIQKEIALVPVNKE